MERMENDAADESAILAHIEKYGVNRKDAVGPAQRIKKKITTPRRRTTRMTLDLHGLRSDEATIRLRSALGRCRETGINELLVIHGYGLHSSHSEGPVLKKLVHDLLDNELQSAFRLYRTAEMKDGGGGATLVILR